MGVLDKLFGGGGEPPELPEFRYELVRVPGAEALATLEKLQVQGRTEGFSPIILGEGKEVERHLESEEFCEDSTEEILKLAEEIDPEEFFRRTAAVDPEYYELPRGDVPDEEIPQPELVSHTNILTGRPLKQVVLAKIPTTRTWEIPAYLFYGDWNECPMPEEHVAVWKRWNEKYGAEIVCVKSDIIEAQVARPPQSSEEALQLAREQFIYCTDIVYQGVETIDNLAATLKNANLWYFWWD